MSFHLDSLPAYLEMDLSGESELVACAERHASALRQVDIHSAFSPADSELAFQAVSEDALRELLRRGGDVGGVGTQREITNAIPFHVRKLPGAFRDRAAARARHRLDSALRLYLRGLFRGQRLAPHLINVATYWYPPHSYMGWHTNSRHPGVRVYLSLSQQPGRSFFRYRDPSTGDVVTSTDGRLTLRLFRISGEQALWHAIHSETDRFSVGYYLWPWSLRGLLVERLQPFVP